MPSIHILHEPNPSEPFVVLEKPAGMPSAPLFEGDTQNALFEAATLFSRVKNVRGKKNIECGLLHRIDTQTRGLLLLATSQEFYDHMISAQERGDFVKTYRAECACDAENARKLRGFPAFPETLDADFCQTRTISSYFRFYGKGRREVRPALEEGSKFAARKIGAKKIYSTKIEFLRRDGHSANVQCEIAQGFRHQVRCHLAWLGFPVAGDALYNYGFRLRHEDAEMRFFATALAFPDLHSQKKMKFEMKLP